MDQLGDKPERIREHLLEEKRRGRKEERESASDRAAAGTSGSSESREAASGDETMDVDDALGDLGEVYRDEVYRGGPGQSL
ncbi:hypothetical protein [Streptomyces sp. NPDC000410]|uniref:hypothetical protein n=1 Tax=Streptomyces sp. NPDC000410 TaxID=3154254 RepID=UPI00332CDF3F